MFESLIKPEYSLFEYVLVVIAFGMVAFLLGLYIAMIWYFGDAGKKYFQARLKSFSDGSVSLFNIFDLNYNITLSFAKELVGGVFQNTEPKHEHEKVIPKSTYSINGITNVMIWDIHPKLNENIIRGLEILKENGCITLSDLKKEAENEHGEEVLFEVQPKSLLKKVTGEQPTKYTYKGFYELLLRTKQKYEVDVKIDDVINFIEKNFDKNYRESIEARLVNVQIKKKMDDKYTKYAFIIIGIIVLGIMITFIYKKVYVVAPVVT